MTASLPSSFELRAGALRLAIRADLGGAIAGLWHDGTPVLRSTEPAELESARLSSSYPMAPYSNRIGDCHFRWNGKDHTTVPNFGGSPHSVHGVAWLRAWDVVSASDDAVHLRYRHAPDAHWPFAFEVDQHFSLTADAATVRCVFKNADAQSQPAGLGWHPYFPKREQSRLDIQIGGRWDSNDRELPVAREAQPRIEGAIADLRYDNCFDGWQGEARIRDEKFSLVLTSNLTNLVVYTPQDKPYYCVEPVSHLSNAIQMDDPTAHGLRDVQPGESFEATMTLAVKPL